MKVKRIIPVISYLSLILLWFSPIYAQDYAFNKDNLRILGYYSISF